MRKKRTFLLIAGTYGKIVNRKVMGNFVEYRPLLASSIINLLPFTFSPTSLSMG